MKRKIAAMMTALFTMISVLPMSAMAAERETVPGQDGQGFTVTATATVTDDDWEELGLNVVVSYPVTVGLSLDGNGKYVGSGAVYAYGMLGAGNKLTVAVDTADASRYGVVKFCRNDGGNRTYVPVDAKYYTSAGAEIGPKTSFTHTETLDNLVAKRKAQAFPYSLTLQGSIDGLIPIQGNGEYVMDIPLKISISPAD